MNKPITGVANLGMINNPIPSVAMMNNFISILANIYIYISPQLSRHLSAGITPPLDESDLLGEMWTTTPTPPCTTGGGPWEKFPDTVNTLPNRGETLAKIRPPALLPEVL